MSAGNPETKVYRAIPIPTSELATGELLIVLGMPGLVVDGAFSIPERGISCVRFSLTRNEGPIRGDRIYATHINEHDLASVGSYLDSVTAENPNTPFGRIIDIHTKAIQVLKEEKERQK